MAEDPDFLAFTIDVVTSYVGRNNMRPDDVPGFIAKTHEAIRALETSPQAEVQARPQQDHVPAVSVRKSLGSPDHIISMIDGKAYKTLRRHLATHGLTPEQYRERYGLKGDYPMVAPSYSETRRGLAHKIGLGRRAQEAVGAVVEAAEQVLEKVAPKNGRRSSKNEFAPADSEGERETQAGAEASGDEGSGEV